MLNWSDELVHQTSVDPSARDRSWESTGLQHSNNYTTGSCKAKSMYLLTSKVSRNCILALQSSTFFICTCIDIYDKYQSYLNLSI